MVKGILPFVLALMALPMILFAYTNPLFQWQISEIVTKIPSSYEVNVSPSPWEIRIGDALNDKTYVFFKIAVLNEGKFCSPKDFSLVVKRSQSDQLLEQLSLWRLFSSHSMEWYLWWILAEIALSMVYLLWFTYWRDHRTIGYTILSGVIAAIAFCFVMVPMAKLMGPRLSDMFVGTANCHGAFTFNAKIVQVYYSVPVMLLSSIFAEFGALIIMVREVVKVSRNRTESSKWAVG
jgi:hypothetical protein